LTSSTMIENTACAAEYQGQKEPLNSDEVKDVELELDDSDVVQIDK